MSPRDIRLWLEDILSSIEAILLYTKGMSKAEFYTNRMAVDAVIRNFIVIGEVSAHISDEMQAKHPEVPWRDMNEMRNVLIHEYFGVSLNIVWQAIQHDLPPLVPHLRAILDNLDK